MCDLKTLNRKSCYGIDGKRLKPVKLTKWELPIPSAKSYWQGVIADVEKKCIKVRQPYPFSFPSPAAPISLSKSFLPDDIKFKISPPTPLHKPFKSEPLDNQKDSLDSEYNTLKLPSPVRKKIKAKPFDKKPPGSIEVKIYPAKSCPLHKREKPCNIFDDNITEYLQRPASSVPKLPRVTKPKRPCEHQKPTLSKSSSASSVRLKSIEKALTLDEFKERRFSKPPKLGMASLLPSFAKPVSTDSSVGTRESLDLEDETVEFQPKIEPLETIPKKNFLRVPNLSFVSSHPSFRKLSHVDSCDKDDLQDMPIIVEEKYSADEIIPIPKKKTLTFKEELEETRKSSTDEPQSVEDTVRNVQDVVITKPSILRKPRPKTVADFDKKYSYKALDLLTKHKHKKYLTFDPSRVQSLKTSLSSEDSMEYETKRYRRGKSAHSKDQFTSIDLKEIQKNLRETAKKYLDLDRIPHSLPSKSDKSTTIRTSSRSTSGPSPMIKSNDVFTPSAEILDKIPKTRLLNRPKIDKCHSCIFKPLTDDRPKMKRELPLTSLKSIVDNSPDIKISSSSSSSSLDELFDINISADEEIDKRFDITKLETLGLSEEDEKRDTFGSKPDLRVSFDETNLSDTMTITVDATSGRAKSPSPKLGMEGRLSVQSMDRSKTSTPTKSQSSDSEGMVESSLPTSKHTAPCHKPLVWVHSLDHLRALRSKKATSLRARAAAQLEETSDDSEEDAKARELKAKEAEDAKKSRKDKRKKKKKKLKPLTRIKTVEEILDKKGKTEKVLRRAKTAYDLSSLTDDSKSDASDEEDESSTAETTSQVEKKEPLPLAEEILKHIEPPPGPPILSTEDILEIVKDCIKDEFDPNELWDKLSKEFVEKLEKKIEMFKNFEEVESLRQGLNLFKALSESRRYIKPGLFDPNLKLSPQKQVPLSNSRLVRRILPKKTFDLVGPILDIPMHYDPKSRKKIFKEVVIGSRRRFTGSDSVNSGSLSTDLLVLPGTVNEDDTTRHVYHSRALEQNPYALFLKKPRRKAVVWRPLKEEDLKGFDPEATLELRAARLLDKICTEFCEWLKKLGDSVIDEETLKDMFEINFSSEACKSMVVSRREMPTVPSKVAKVRQCLAASKLEMTKKEIQKDLEVEKRERRTHAFGRALDPDQRFVPPLRKLAEIWMKNERVPKDLETMDIVWDGIMHLDSVKSFIKYLKNNQTTENNKLLTKLLNRDGLADSKK